MTSRNLKSPLPPKPLVAPNLLGPVLKLFMPVIFFDPSPIYSRVQINPHHRHQSHLRMDQMWPTTNNRCACGCLGELTGRKTRWLQPNHAEMAVKIYEVIKGREETIFKCISAYYGLVCAGCASCDCKLDLDHIIPVKLGGGGSWLCNYQLLCKSCHNEKTRRDFGWGEFKPSFLQ